MDQKISIQIFKAIKSDFKSFYNENSDISKLNFIKSLLKKFEKYNMNDIYNLNISPFINDPQHILDEIKNMKENVLSFLSRMSETEKDTNRGKVISSYAYVLIGICYEHGILGMPLDGNKAYRFYDCATRLDSSWGYFRKAMCYEKGIGTVVNPKKALVFYRISAKMGYVEALHVYGAVLLYGQLNTQQDIPNGIFFLSRAAKKANYDYPYPFFDLAQFYEGKLHQEHEDIKYAIELYTIGADKGCPNCLFKMAMIYEFGHLGKKKKMSKALPYYIKSAEAGHSDGQIAMASFYSTGLPGLLNKDLFEAFKYAVQSATKGNKNAAFFVGQCYEYGKGIKTSIMNALWWYTIAASFGHERSKDKVRILSNYIRGPY